MWVIIIVLFTSCTEERSAGDKDAAIDLSKDSTAWEIPTETYSGFVKGTEVIFQHLNYTRFKLSVGGEQTQGEMNTQRGFNGDGTATLYILNSDRPGSEQAYFVRYSNGEVFMLDQQQQPLKRSKFTKQ